MEGVHGLQQQLRGAAGWWISDPLALLLCTSGLIA